MLYQKLVEYPEEEELVLCTVTSVQYHSVFVTLDEYKGKTGMIHISEVSPGRIRNIRDFVVEGKKVICKVLNINQEKGHIDLSLRRVNEAQKRRKNDEIKQELKAEKIIQSYVEKNKLELKKFYEELAKPILANYEYIHEAFQEVVNDALDLKKLGIAKNVADELSALIKEKIKPKEIEVKGKFIIKSYDENGLEIIKSALRKAKDISTGNNITYEGGGAYRFTVKASDYKEGEKILKQSVEACLNFLKEKKTFGEFKRTEQK